MNDLPIGWDEDFDPPGMSDLQMEIEEVRLLIAKIRASNDLTLRRCEKKLSAIETEIKTLGAATPS